MSQLRVALTQSPIDPQWGKNAVISFEPGQANIHLGQGEPLKTIKKAARILESMGTEGVALEGQWDMEQQWAFACSFIPAKNNKTVQWCKDENHDLLVQRFSAMQFTRSIINGTPEDISPESLADKAADWLKTLAPEAISVKAIVGEALQAAGWTGIYNVGRGSTRPPVLLEVDYNPTGDANAPVAAALVGKGITFDSGGYSIKPSEGMVTMKCDMGGAATVTGGLGLAIISGLNKRVKLFLCCAENLISGHAYKLGDILTYKNGTTVEIVNTDAEGRLVLADGLMAAGETGAPLIIDAATLTGAAMMAVGSEYNALFGLDKPLQQQVLTIAEQENEPAWPLPLELWHQDQCPSPYADTANSRAQKGGGFGGASNAAGFLSRFVPNQGKGWVHMDLAAAFNSSPTAYAPAGATGHGIRTIAKLLTD